MKNITANFYIKFIAACALNLCFAITAKAQQAPSNNYAGIADKMDLYAKKNQAPILFVHFDKTIYTTNESVWFTAYLLKASNYNVYKALSVALVKDDSHVVMKDDRFVMKSGTAFGNFLIPDSLITGNYSLIAYTNYLVNGKPDVLFTQSVTIKENSQPAFTASLNPLDTSASIASQKIMLLVNFSDEKKIPVNVPVSYYVGNSAHPVLKGEIRTKDGQYNFNIPSNLISYGNNRLHVQVKYNKEVKELTIDLPAQVRPAMVKFYPEGGNLIAGLPNTIGWEAKSYAGGPLRVQAMLYQDNQIIDTIETDSYGLGRFLMMPKYGSSYYVKLYGVNKKDTLYKLPDAVNHMPQITVRNAIADSVLLVDLKSNYQKKMYVVVHNYKQVFSETLVDMNEPAKRMRFILNDIPKGLNQITVTDSIGRPFAERMFFAHYDKRNSLQITTGKDNYTPRQKVNLKIKLNPSVLVDSGVVSIACVQENRIELKKQNDIESYFYLRNYLEEMPVKDNYLGFAEGDKRFLENILLIKGWRRYTWTDMLKTIPADTVLKNDSIIFKGTVTKGGSKLKKPVEVINLLNILNETKTDSSGNFILDDNDVIALDQKKIGLVISNDKANIYQIHLPDPYMPNSNTLAENMVLNDLTIPQQQTTQLMADVNMQQAIQLREVKITANKNSDLYFNLAKGANECGDYVCQYGVLNCANHPFGGTPPVVGRVYNRGTAPYMGCKPVKDKVMQFKGIYTAQEFYPADYSEINPSQPEYVSTIYWKYQAKVSSAKEAEFSFYTSDITGDFKIVVQGITFSDTIYGEKTFKVTKAQ